MATSVFEEINIVFNVQRGCPQKGALLLFVAVCIIGKCAHNEMWVSTGSITKNTFYLLITSKSLIFAGRNHSMK